ncbi:MAG: glycoside hydrolase family 3 N-terminal domain-containing protein, partial [Acidobacteriota bacterium]
MRACRQIFTLTLALAAAAISCAQSTPRYLDPKVPIEQRIDDLLPRMTLDEKIAQISNANGSMGIARLRVPALYKTEAIHGQATSVGATLFPQSIALGATFDPVLVGRIATVAGIESRVANLRFAWAPVINLARDVRWGRVEETYGESPYLTSQMGVAWINAYQAQGLIAAPKHYAVHGGPLGGRDSTDVGYSDRVLREIYLPAFRAAIEQAHAGGIMPAYSTWQGVPDNSSEVLLRQILQQEWGFDGIIVSDCGALENFYDKQGTAHSMAEAAAQALRAGVTLNCGATYRTWAAKALEQGLIAHQQLDDTVRVMLRAKFRLGLFDSSQPNGIVTTKLPT